MGLEKSSTKKKDILVWYALQLCNINTRIYCSCVLVSTHSKIYMYCFIVNKIGLVAKDLTIWLFRRKLFFVSVGSCFYLQISRLITLKRSDNTYIERFRTFDSQRDISYQEFWDEYYCALAHGATKSTITGDTKLGQLQQKYIIFFNNYKLLVSGDVYWHVFVVKLEESRVEIILNCKDVCY